MSMKEISPVSFGGEAERLGMVSMHSRCLPWLPDNTWSLQTWVRESKRKETTNNRFSVSKNPLFIEIRRKKEKDMALVFFTHRRTYHILLFLPVHVLVLFLVSVCLLSLSALLFWMNSESRWELISPWRAATRYWEEAYWKKIWISFAWKYFIMAILNCVGCVGIPVAVVLKDIGLIPGPTDAVVYLTVLFQVYVCTSPCGGITGDWACINHGHQCLINNGCVFLLSLFKRSSRELGGFFSQPSTDLLCCLW